MAEQSINTMSCPLCGKNNNCGNLIGLPEGTCWCGKVEFPRDIFQRIPTDLLNKSCICQACLEKFA